MENTALRKSRAFPIFCFSVAILSFAEFLLYYIPNGFFYENTPLLYAASYLINFLEALLVPLSAMIIFLSKKTSIKSKILPCILISLLRVFYSVPYYYIYYVSDVFNSIEAILLAFLVSIFFLSFFFLQTFICILIMNYTEKRSGGETCEREKTKLFDLENHLNFGIALSILFVFVIFFIREAIATVEYLTENASSYRSEEILTIVLSFLVLFVFSFIHYVITVKVKNKIV